VAALMRVAVAEKTFAGAGEAPPRRVFAEFSLDVPEGQVCVVTGPSGVGKSTLLSLIAGLDREFSGGIEGRMSPIGFMFQTPRLLPWATVVRNVELAIPGRESEAPQWIAAVGLAGSETVFPEKLSLGMARRAGLARALAVRPALLLLDEPFASLDRETAKTVCELLRAEIATRTMTVLMVTHELALASELADRVVVLEGAPARIMRDVSIAADLPGVAVPGGVSPSQKQQRIDRKAMR
jgi:ABC-type nitrate/sulfonate/bicarbonate transport system ATPase subunit